MTLRKRADALRAIHDLVSEIHGMEEGLSEVIEEMIVDLEGADVQNLM